MALEFSPARTYPNALFPATQRPAALLENFDSHFRFTLSEVWLVQTYGINGRTRVKKAALFRPCILFDKGAGFSAIHNPSPFTGAKDAVRLQAALRPN